MSNKTTDRKEGIKRRYHKSLLVQLSIAAVFICFLLFTSSKNQQVQIERNTIPTKTRSLKKYPTVESVLALKQTLELSPKQVKQLTDLKAEKDKRLVPIDKQLKIAVDDFKSFMSSKGKKRTNMGEIFSHSAPATNIGMRRRILIESYSQKGIELLSSKQNKLANELISKPGSKSKASKENGDVNVAN